MANTLKEKRFLRKCNVCGGWCENVHPYKEIMLCPVCATKEKYKVKQKDTDEDKTTN